MCSCINFIQVIDVSSPPVKAFVDHIYHTLLRYATNIRSQVFQSEWRRMALKHVSALIVLFLIVTVALGITLGVIGDASLGQVLIASVILTLVAYSLGDLVILAATNNWIGIAADALATWAVLRIVVPDVAVGSPLLWSIIG